MDNSLVLNLDWLAFSVRLIPSPREKDNHGFVLNVDDAERRDSVSWSWAERTYTPAVPLYIIAVQNV